VVDNTVFFYTFDTNVQENNLKDGKRIVKLKINQKGSGYCLKNIWEFTPNWIQSDNIKLLWKRTIENKLSQ
jgi:hypothetical protein